MFKRFKVSWSEDNIKFSFKTNSLIKAFAEVYAVKEFVICWNNYKLIGSAFIDKDTKYDYAYFYMISCFLTPKQINKLYKIFIKE